jgi:hypothetical protein
MWTLLWWQLFVQQMELPPTVMESFVSLTNLTELECSYERKLLSYMQPDQFKTFHAVSEVGGTRCMLCHWLAVPFIGLHLPAHLIF